jgi:two-component system CheB/CheR fusion protein
MALPLKKEKVSSDPRETSSGQQGQDGSVNILLVDDQAANLDALESILVSPEYRIVRAQTANEALLALLQADFAAIVLDMKMPDVSGIDLAMMIKERKRTRHIPILFLTAYMLEERDVLRGYGVGAADYLSKPVNPEILKSKISVFIDLFRKTRALAVANQALEAEIDERQRAQEALRKANEELEARVNERTADLTRLNECLRESEEYFREVTHSMPHIVWTSLPDGTVDFVNRRWTEYTGQTLHASWSFREVWLAGVHPEDHERAETAYLEGMRSRQDFSVEARIVRSDGLYRWHLSRCVPLHDATGNLLKFLVTCTDIDEQKSAEEALREADCRKNEFLATLAHELRNPLAPIRNSLEILRLKEGDMAVMAQARSIMERQLSQMVRLIDDLLDVSRITSGRIQLRRERVELSQILQIALETSRPVITEAGHQLAISVPPEKIVLDADVTRLAQVFSNLLNNAAKYSEKRGRIQLVAERENDRIDVKVKDTGIGISREMLPKVFDMFVQADRRIERTHGGLGIGLTLVQRLVELHGGTVEARSEGPGKGSEFIVRLPILTPQPLPSKEESARPRAASVMGRSRIVIADDNQDAARSLAQVLEHEGNEIRLAHDGMEALEVAESYRPDIVILDIGMPKLNGYEVARRIREKPWSKRVLLVALTGWGQDEDQRRASEAGFDRHLIKPIDPGVVHEIVLESQARAHAPDQKRG